MTATQPIGHEKANKTDAGNGSKAICRVSNVVRWLPLDPSRPPNFEGGLLTVAGVPA
ncbi:MAG: hypothetical protein JNM99_22905 [Verrucomicrobiaceae bacterium]|nr:hypothetical protein [Verrucomicrobiaceae bacterium]